MIAHDVDEDEAGLMAWDVGRTAPTPLGPIRRLPTASYDVNPVDGSVLEPNGDRTFTLLTETSISRLPIEAGLAAWASDGVHVVTTPTDDSVALGTVDGRERWRTTVPLSIGALAVGPGGMVAVAGGDLDAHRTVVVLDGDGSVISEIRTHAYRLAFDPSGARIVTLDDGGPLQLWDVASARLAGALRDAGTEPMVAFTPDGSVLALMGLDQTVRLYDADTLQLRVTLPRPLDQTGEFCGAKSVAFDADGTMLASQDCDGVRVWAIDIDELLAIARTRVTRSLTPVECRRFLHVASC